MNKMSASRADKRETEEKLLEDFIQYSLRAVRGLGSIAEEEGRELVRKMVEIGRVTPEEGERILNALLYRMNSSKELFHKKVEETVHQTVNRLSSVSSREVDSLRTRLNSIDQRIQNLVSKRKNFSARA